MDELDLWVLRLRKSFNEVVRLLQNQNIDAGYLYSSFEDLETILEELRFQNDGGS